MQNKINNIPKEVKLIISGALTVILVKITYWALDNDILPGVKKVEYKQYSGIGPNAKTFNIPKEIIAPNPLDTLIKISLLFFLALSYWYFLKYLLANSTIRFLIFIISIPIAYFTVFIINV